MTKTGSWSVEFDITLDGKNVKFDELSYEAQQEILDDIRNDFYSGEISEEIYDIFEDEGNENGIIEVVTTETSYGGRCTDEVCWELSHIDDDTDTESEWHVKAIVVKTEIPKFPNGFEFDFYLDKDVNIWDLDSVILEAYNNYFA